MPALHQNNADTGMTEPMVGVSSLTGRSLTAPAAFGQARQDQDAPLAAHDTRGSARGIRQGDSGMALMSRGRDAGGQTEARVRVSAPHSPTRFGGHRAGLNASLGSGRHGAGVSCPAALELGVPQAGRGTPLHPAGLAPLARAAAPAALARHHDPRGTAPAPRQEAFPRSAEGGPNSVEEKTPMSDVVSPGGVEPARAPLLRSPTNPDGLDLRDLLSQVRDELAAENAPLRGRHGSMDQPEYALRQEVLKALTHADSLASQLASVMALRVRAAEEEAAAARSGLIAADTVVSLPLGRKLPGGAYHPSGWPARDAA